MGDVVNIKPLDLAENQSFVADCCRFFEGILCEANMKRKYGFTDNVWERLGDDTALLGAVEEEKIRRVRTGQQKRERAQVFVTAAPDVMSKILLDDAQSPRHRIDAAASLDKFAANPADSMPTTSDRFIITINLGADHVEHFNKSIAINADDTPDGGSATPVKTSAPTHTGYRQVDHEGLTDKKPTTHKPVGLITDSRSAYDIALASLMEKG